MANRHVIRSNDLLSCSAVPRPRLARAPRGPGVERTVGRTFQLLLGLSALGAVLHDGLRLSGALLFTFLALPILAALVHLVLDSRYLDLDGLLPSSPTRTALLVPVLVLPGALLGWYGAAALLALAVLALTL